MVKWAVLGCCWVYSSIFRKIYRIGGEAYGFPWASAQLGRNGLNVWLTSVPSVNREPNRKNRGISVLENQKPNRNRNTLVLSVLGCFCLGLIWMGFCFLNSFYPISTWVVTTGKSYSYSTFEKKTIWILGFHFSSMMTYVDTIFFWKTCQKRIKKSSWWRKECNRSIEEREGQSTKFADSQRNSTLIVGQQVKAIGWWSTRESADGEEEGSNQGDSPEGKHGGDGSIYD
jgi:hypothetical protein